MNNYEEENIFAKTMVRREQGTVTRVHTVIAGNNGEGAVYHAFYLHLAEQ
jgi:hypothetical protein